MKVFTRQQTAETRHQKRMIFNRSFFPKLSAFFTIALFLFGCSFREKTERAKLLKVENAAQSDLINEVNRFAKVNSMRARMDLKFEDNSYAEVGLAEKYKTADGEIVVQRPNNILLKVQIPIIKTDIAQMTSDGEKFHVAVLEDGAGGKYRSFVSGTNNADYSALQAEIKKADLDGKVMKQNLNAFANLRPQHFSEAILVRPADLTNQVYATSTILQDEEDNTMPKKSPIRRVLRGYYLLDEYGKNTDGGLRISRRFWFDRVGGIRLARQQIFDEKGEIESDITYGQQGDLSDQADYKNLPLEISVTRPKEKYRMRLTYQSPASVSIGKTYPAKAFVLENTWGLQEVDLDKKLTEARGQKTKPLNEIPKTATRFQ